MLITRLAAIWKGLRKRGRMESEMDAELRFHIGVYADDLERSGMDRAEAERLARLEFGSLDIAKDDCRRALGLRIIDDLGQDLRYALRGIRKRPAFTAAAVVSLALGIGANIAVFSILNALLLQSLPVQQPYELVILEESGNPTVAYPVYDQIRRGSRQLSVIGMSRSFERPSEIQERGEKYPAYVQMVSDNYFDVLGIRAFGGDFFRDQGADRSELVAVISESYWRRHYASNPAALGARFRFRNLEFTVMGIAPPDFGGAEIDLPTDIWVPMERTMPAGSDERLRGRMFRAMGRLRPQANVAQADAEANSILQGKARLQPGATGYSTLRGRLSRPLLLLALVVGVVLFITCANLANLIMAGTASRGRELAARQALGASRSRLVRQLFTESLAICASGGLLALAVAYWTSAALLSFLPPEQAPALANLRFELDLRRLGFAALVCFLTCLLFGLIPALRATRAHSASLVRAGAGAGQRERTWASRGLVIGEVAMCTLLLMVATVFVRSLGKLRGQDTGYREAGLLVADIDPPREYREAQRDRFFEELRERTASIPGVEAAAFSHLGQMSGGGIEYRVRVPGAAARLSDADRDAFEQRVSPGFLEAMGTRLSAGRDFTERDDANSPPVAIVNEAFVRRFYPDTRPIGQRFKIDRVDRTRSWEAEIVGVAKDSKWVNLRNESPVMYYRPYRQSAGRPSVRFAIRSTGDLRALAAGFVQAAQSIDRHVALKNVVPFREIVNRTLLIERLVAQVSAAFGVLGLVIAAVGLYGVLAYGVARRRREIGVRIAVGASPGSVEWMILRESLVLLVLGFVVGVPAAVLVTRLVSSMLFELSPGDPASLIGALAVLTVATMAAAYLPARRAAGTDPILVLREE